MGFQCTANFQCKNLMQAFIFCNTVKRNQKDNALLCLYIRNLEWLNFHICLLNVYRTMLFTKQNNVLGTLYLYYLWYLNIPKLYTTGLRVADFALRNGVTHLHIWNIRSHPIYSCLVRICILVYEHSPNTNVSYNSFPLYGCILRLPCKRKLWITLWF